MQWLKKNGTEMSFYALTVALICSDQSVCVLLQVLSIDFVVAFCVALILTAGIDVL